MVEKTGDSLRGKRNCSWSERKIKEKSVELKVWCGREIVVKENNKIT